MADQSLTDRVERLERAGEGLQTLPGEVAALGERVGSLEMEVSQLRTEMRAEFAAVRTEMHEGFVAYRNEMLSGFASVKSELSQQIHESAEEGKRHTRVLFEEALSRIAILAEHRTESSRRKQEAPRRKR